MKKVFGFMAFLFFSFQSYAQFQVTDLLPTVGIWYGQLTYLDYSSGKPYSMAANLRVRLTENQLGYIRTFEYPKEPHANSTDTLFVDKQHLGDSKIVSFENKSPSVFSWVLEKMGEDGNDHRKAIIRQSYTINSAQYRIIKEVQFVGTTTWIKRHEYLFHR